MLCEPENQRPQRVALRHLDRMPICQSLIAEAGLDEPMPRPERHREPALVIGRRLDPLELLNPELDGPDVCTFGRRTVFGQDDHSPRLSPG